MVRTRFSGRKENIISLVESYAKEQNLWLNDELKPSKDLRHTAVIPQFVLDQSLREKWTNADWKKWANDSDNKMFRTWNGKV